MKKYWDNLRSSERRIVAGFGALFFVVLNVLFVFPHFSDLSAVQYQMEEAQHKLTKYQAEIARTNIYAAGLREFEREGSQVALEDQTFQFANTIQTEAIQSGVHPLSAGKINTQTNQFFIEKSQAIQVTAGEQELVSFLYKLGEGESQTRVRGLSVRPELPARQQLAANITLVASYQKKPSPRAASAPATGVTPGPANATFPARTATPLPKKAHSNAN